MKKILLILFPITFSILLGQGKSGGMGNLKLPSHARDAALGDATVADPTAFSSSAINPSLLLYSQRLEFTVSHQEWIEDSQSEHFALVFPFSVVALGFSLSTTSINGIELRDQPGPPRGTFSSRYGAVGLSGATAISPDFQVGLTIKYLYEKILVDEADGWGLDVGLAYQPGIEGLSFGASLRDLGIMNPLRTSSTRLPTRITGGASFQTRLEEKISTRFVTSLSRELSLSTLYAAAGVEIEYSRLLSIRLGYQSGYSTRGFSAGIGFSSLPMLFDYSFTPFSFSLGNAHLLSLGIRL